VIPKGKSAEAGFSHKKKACWKKKRKRHVGSILPFALPLSFLSDTG
jgi:hypothetical protein